MASSIKSTSNEYVLNGENTAMDKSIFNLNTDCPYFIKEQGDYFGKLTQIANS